MPLSQDPLGGFLILFILAMLIAALGRLLFHVCFRLRYVDDLDDQFEEDDSDSEESEELDDTEDPQQEKTK